MPMNGRMKIQRERLYEYIYIYIYYKYKYIYIYIYVYIWHFLHLVRMLHIERTRQRHDDDKTIRDVILDSRATHGRTLINVISNVPYFLYIYIYEYYYHYYYYHYYRTSIVTCKYLCWINRCCFTLIPWGSIIILVCSLGHPFLPLGW